MKKFLKKQGKKVSVILLATALMISPMLPIVKAASGCETKKSVYLFSFADTMVTEEVPYNDFYAHQEESMDDYTYNSKVIISFTDDYLNTYGWDATQSKALIGETIYDKLAKDSPDSYEMKSDKGGKGYDPKNIILEGGYGEADKLVKNITDNDSDGKITLYDALTTHKTEEFKFTPSSTNPVVSVKNIADFKLEIPNEAENIKENVSNSWSDNDIKAMIELEKQNIGKDTDDQLESYTSGDTTYYMHGSWQFVEDGIVKYDGDRYSVIYNKIKYLKDRDSSGKSGEWSAFENMYKKAQVPNVETAINVTDNGINSMGDTIKGEITRNITAADLLNKKGDVFEWYPLNWFYDDNGTTTGEDPGEDDKYVYVNDKYEIDKAVDNDTNKLVNVSRNDNVKMKNMYWYFVPATYEMEYTLGTCVDDTGDGNGSEPGAGEDNSDTGIVSYAIIGTLLVGAASAYIYARKSNKFNKL